MRRPSLKTSVQAALVFAIFASSGMLHAQVCGPTYSVQPQVVWERQLEKRMRTVMKPVYEQREVVNYRRIPVTKLEKRSYTVRKPVTETRTVQEQYTVMRPVVKREYVEQEYQQTDYVTETGEYEQTYTSYKPVTETRYAIQNQIVNRPVVETQMQTLQRTTYKPVTSYRTAVVDQGQYVAQQYYQPGDTRYGLRWLPGGYQINQFGTPNYRRGGLGWVPYTSPGDYFTQMQYRPNPVQVAVPQTNLVPQVEQVQVPTQVTRMQQETIQRQVPYNVTQMVPTQETRRIPYSVQKPVTKTLTRKVPVDRVEYVQQTMVRPKTIEETRFKYETVEREVPVTYYETQPVVNKVQVRTMVPTLEEYDVVRLVPRTVNSPVVLSYSDPYAVPLSMGQSTWLPSNNSSDASVRRKVTYGEGVPLDETASDNDDQRSMKKIETVPDSSDGESATEEDAELTLGDLLSTNSGA